MVKPDSWSVSVDGFDNKGYKQEVIGEDTGNGQIKKYEMNGKNRNTSSSSSDDCENDKEETPVVFMIEMFRYATVQDWTFMAIGLISAGISGALQPISYIIFGELIDKFIYNDSGKQLDMNKEFGPFAVYYVYVGLAAIVFGYLQNMLWLRSSINQAFRIRTMAFESILRQEIGWFETTDTGELSTRLVDDITKIQNGIGDKIGSFLNAISMLMCGIIIGFIYSWKLTMVIIAMSPLFFLGAFATGKVIGAITSQEQISYAKAGNIAEEVISAIKTVVAFGGENKEIERYKVNLREAKKAGIKKGLTTGFAFAFLNITLFGCMALGCWYGGILVRDEELTGGRMLVVFFSVMMGANQFGKVGPNIEAFSASRGAAHFIYRLIERMPVINSMDDKGSKPKMLGNIDFVKCRFNYPSRPGIDILKGLSLRINPGTTVALVGESGCGKSTIVKLVQRFYDVTDGSVYIDNTDIREINVKYLRKHIGVVSQEPVLFDTSIKKNILMGNPGATEEMIIDAAKSANAHQFIAALPQGYETNVGQGGAQLSGGQKQRIAIARALVRDPKILLLDESTSALDTESEAIVRKALEKASVGRTTIVIAHRLSTIKNADMVAVVSNGGVIETGSHSELMAKRGDYFKFVMLQNIKEQSIKEDKFSSDKVSLISDAERASEEDQAALKHMLSKETAGCKPFTNRISVDEVKIQRSKLNNEEIIEEEVDEKDIPGLSRILKMNATEWPYIVLGMFFSAIAGMFPVLFAIVLAEFLQSFATTNKDQLEEDMEFWSIMFLVLGFTTGVSLFISQYMLSVAGETLTTRIRETAFAALLRQEIGYFDLPEHSTGALASRLASDASAVQGATSTRLNTLTRVFVTAVSSLIVAFIFSWKLTFLVLAFVPFIAFCGVTQTRLNTSFAAKAQKELSEASSVATEAIMQIRTVVSVGKEDFFYERYKNLLAGPTKGQLKEAHMYGVSFGFSVGVMYFSNAACFRLGGYLADVDGLTISDIIKVMIGIQFGAETAGHVASFAPDYVKAKIAAGRILKLLNRVPEIDSYSTEGRKDEIKGDITFTDVKFNYPSRPNIQIIQGLSIEISSGSTVALVGASGCGKSTSVTLIERFYSLASGQLQIDGVPIEEYNVRSLRSQIGIVQQEPVLFDRSIRDNILYGIEHPESISQKEIDDACKNANIYHVIMNLPNGFDTEVGEKGSLISGGQKQRIAIARALVRNPKILLLDEATSALDSESEKHLQFILNSHLEASASWFEYLQ